MTGAEKDTLIALVEQGPLWDGDVPSKHGRDLLLAHGLAVRVVVKGEEWLATGDDGKCPFCGSSDTSPKDDGDAAIDAALDKADK